MDTSFRDRFNAWKQGKTVYKNGLRISFDEGKDANPEQPVEQPDLSAALDYVRGVKRDVLLNFDEGKDVAGGHHFNAIKQISPNAGLSYGSYYDKLTGDWMIDARRQGLPRFRGGKNSGFRPTPRQLRTINVIVQNLRDAGFNDYDIAGILANGKIESSFDPAAVNKSDHRGVWQNETVRHRGVSKVYGDHSLGSQIKYLIDWEASGGKPTELLDDTLAAHGNVIFKKGTYKSAREAALAFERAYERSNGQIMGGRLNQADMIYDWLRATSPGSIVVNNSNTDRPLIGNRRIIPPTQRVVTTTPPPAAPTNAGLWDNLAIPRPLVPYDDGKDVDTRSDTTRQGYHEGNIPWGAGLDSGGQGPLWLLENVGAGMGNPNFNSRSRFQAMLPFAIGGGLWAAEDKYRDGKDVNLGPKRNVSIQEARDGANRIGYEKPMSGTDPLLKWIVPQRMFGKAIQIARSAINNSLRRKAQSDYRHARQTYDRNASRFIATPDNAALDILNWETRLLNFGL